jgi:hypothetical protein
MYRNLLNDPESVCWCANISTWKLEPLLHVSNQRKGRLTSAVSGRQIAPHTILTYILETPTVERERLLLKGIKRRLWGNSAFIPEVAADERGFSLIMLAGHHPDPGPSLVLDFHRSGWGAGNRISTLGLSLFGIFGMYLLVVGY